jgi:AraC-like DNA-binding protein
MASQSLYLHHLTGAAPEPAERIRFNHYDVYSMPAQDQLLAWRERMGQIIDVVTTRDLIAMPFRGHIDRFDVGEFLFANCYTDAITLDRSIARISQDNARSVVFHVFVDGDPTTVLNHTTRHDSQHVEGGVLAVDLDQPLYVHRGHCRHITIFCPAKRVLDVFPDPGAMHGRVLSPREPAVRLIVERALALTHSIRRVSPEEAHRELAGLVELIVDAFGDQAGLRGSKRAVERALMFAGARRYVHGHLADADLTPEQVIDVLDLPRSTLYRMFQHEGGLGAYIRHLRLRAAANDLVRLPGLAVKDIAYSIGFKSASDFTRAFRRAYGIAPLDLRNYRSWGCDSGCDSDA